MFDDLLRELRYLEDGVRVPIDIPLDDDGYMDRRCPSEACEADFKVPFDDWGDHVADERVYCPICRHEAEATEWNTPEQEEHIAQVGLQYVQGVVDRGLCAYARNFNRQFSAGRGFLKMSMSVRPSSTVIIIPSEAAGVMRQQFTCEACQCRYASVGAAFFCPACGHNSARSTFDQTMTTVEKTLDSLKRQILENTLGRLVGAFQRLSEALFDTLPNRSRFSPRRNVFQNLTQSSDLWEQAGKPRYEQLLQPREYDDLRRLFQQRHLIAHRDGIVDQDYVERSGDQTYQPGQRLVVREFAVRRLLELVSKLGTALRHCVR